MKTLTSTLAYFVRGSVRRNLKLLLLYLTFLVALIVVYAFLFRYFMWRFEGREYSLTAGFYWTITAMTTLGFGDITFTTDAGHIYSMLVTLSGVLFMLIILPFGAISLFIGPWMEERLRYRPRLALPPDTAGHVIICGWDPVTRTVADSLRAAGESYVLVEGDYDRAARLEEAGVKLIYGVPTDRDVLERAQLRQARALVANLSDTDNANLLLTSRALAPTPVLVVVTEAERAPVIRAAGAGETVALREVLGGYLAVRATTRGSMAHVVDSLGELLFSEIPAHGTPFAGLTVAEAAIRERTGASLIGIWERGSFSLPKPQTRIETGAVLLLAGTRASLEILERMAGDPSRDDLVIVIGYGTVGRAAVAYLERDRVAHVLVDRDLSQSGLMRSCLPSGGSSDNHRAAAAPRTNVDAENGVPGHRGSSSTRRRLVEGDASRRAVLEEARIGEAGGIIVTTNDDGTNVFLTLACRQLNPTVRIVARANREENVEEIYAAGADFVVSAASVGASILINAIEGRQTVFLTEGVHIFRRRVPKELEGQDLVRSRIRETTGATVIAVQQGDADPDLNVGPATVLPSGGSLLMVGTPASETAFSERFFG